MNSILLFIFSLGTLLSQSDAACKLPDATVKDFDIKKYYGEWHELYHIPNKVEADTKCEIDHFHAGNNGGDAITNSAFIVGDPGRSALTGTIKVIKDSIINITFSGHEIYFKDNGNGPSAEDWKKIYNSWSGEYHILATDYENYALYSFCHPDVEEPMVWIGFKSWKPDQAVVDKAKKSLPAINYKFEQFQENCPEKYA